MTDGGYPFDRSRIYRDAELDALALKQAYVDGGYDALDEAVAAMRAVNDDPGHAWAVAAWVAHWSARAAMDSGESIDDERAEINSYYDDEGDDVPEDDD